MGFLVRRNFPAFSKAVFSFWFRIPEEVFTIMDGIPPPPDFPESNGDGLMIRMAPPFYQVIPLMSFGSVVTDTDTGLTCCPSFIGIDCFRGAGFEKMLACRMQTPVDGEVDTEDSPGIPGAFYVNGNANSTTVAGAPITSGVWHHGLISFDIGGSCASALGGDSITYSSSCSFTWALDDVANNRETLSPSGNNDGLSDTGIITNWNIFGNIDHPGSSFSGGFIDVGDFSFPSGGLFSDKVRKIEMAKVQVYTGVTLDTSIVGNRRAFITADRRPAASSLGAALLGKAPAIHFDTSRDWIDGRNRGTAGNFTKTGTINTFPGP